MAGDTDDNSVDSIFKALKDNVKTTGNKQANPNFKDVIEENNHKDSYEVAKAFKSALKHCTFWGTIVLGLFGVFALVMFGGIFYTYTRDLMGNVSKSTVFMSHVWTFTFGAITSISAMLTVRNK